MISSAIWNKQALVDFFQRPQIALALRVRAILLVLKKLSLAYLFQIALEIMWLPVQIEPLQVQVLVLFFVFFEQRFEKFT